MDLSVLVYCTAGDSVIALAGKEITIMQHVWLAISTCTQCLVILFSYNVAYYTPMHSMYVDISGTRIR